MHTEKNLIAELTRHENCHCTIREQIDRQTVEAVCMERQTRKAFIKWKQKGSDFIVWVYTTKDHHKPFTDVIESTDSIEEIRTKITNLYVLMDNVWANN